MPQYWYTDAMIRLVTILLVLAGASALYAHPFDDRADMVAEIMLIKNKEGREAMRLSIQYRYESFYSSYNEAMLEIDNDRSETIDRQEVEIRFRELAKDLQDSVYLAVKGVPTSITPRYEDFYFGNLDDPDATPDQPGGMPCLKLRIGYYFLFDVIPGEEVIVGRHKVEFFLANDRIVVQNPNEQLLAWDDRGERRRAVPTVTYDRTPERFARVRFIWDVEDVAVQPIPGPDNPTEVTTPTQPGGKEQLLETDRERHDPDAVESRIQQAFEDLRDGDAGLWVWLAVLGSMFIFGAYHAVQPGHGKTLVASYLIGTQGKKSDAIFLGIVVTAAHTSGVYLLLGGAWIFKTFWPGLLENPEKQLAEWITLAVGATIFLMGFGLVMKRTGGGHHEHDIFGRHVHPEDDHHHHHEHGHDHHHHHDHDHHDHDHDHPHTHSHDEKHPEDSDIHEHAHSHDHGHSHSDSHSHDHGDGHHHEELDPSKMTRWEILRLGILGGIIPCPSAFVIGLIALQQRWYTTGLIMVLAFSVGLAAVLTAIGLALVHGKAYMNERRKESKSKLFRLLEAKLPVFGALVITMIGVVMVMFALIRLDLIDPAKFTV